VYIHIKNPDNINTEQTWNLNQEMMGQCRNYLEEVTSSNEFFYQFQKPLVSYETMMWGNVKFRIPKDYDLNKQGRYFYVFIFKMPFAQEPLFS